VLPAWNDQLQQFLLRWHLPQRHDLLSDRPGLWHYVLPDWTGLPQRHYVLPGQASVWQHVLPGWNDLPKRAVRHDLS